jgi:serine/threonine-protein kinase
MSTPSSLSGQRLGAYDVGSPIGVGGMGEVYRARDTKLNRDVAIKVLLAAVAGDPERLARFRREAQTLASLNHPGIAQIHGLEDSASGPFLVMELVDGPTLADRIALGPIPVDEALVIARQIVDALEAAHERGIIHRDLKPANIKVRDDGTVKILDFGLAKALDQGSGSGDRGSAANSPTITSPAMTQAGLILGTAAYMSPEQAKGRVVDKRTDVWAFGCVLYEMLTGKRAFDGEDVTETIAGVVRGEPDWSALPAETPSQVRLLLKRCLEKDRRTRIGDISVARFLLNERIEPSGGVPDTAHWPRSRGRVAVAAAAAGLIAGAAAVAVAWAVWGRMPQMPARAVRFTITPPADQPLRITTNRDVVMAPDGSYFLYSSRAKAQQFQLMMRDLDGLDARPLLATLGLRFAFISPDGQWIGFYVEEELRKVATNGGGAVTICRLARATGASWGDDGSIVVATFDGLYRVAADGGEPKALITADSTSQELYYNPHVLPGSAWVLFTVRTGADMQDARIDAFHLATRERKTVIRGGYDAAFLNSGHLVYVVAQPSSTANARPLASLRATYFDPVGAEVSGDSVEMLGPLEVVRGGPADYSVSRHGDLVFMPTGTGAGPPARRLVWVDRKGRETAIAAEPRSYEVGRISPDGTRIALDLRDQTNDMWIWDIARQTLTSLSRDPGQDMSPLWTPDAKRIIWTSSRGGGFPNLFWQAADGSGVAERLTTNPTVQFPTSITPDGSTVLGFTSSGGNRDLFRVPLAKGVKAESLLPGASVEYGPEISPDGKWMAYHSDESGELQVFVRPYPNVEGGRYPVSTAGGSRAAWSRNGRELFYLDREGFLTAVPVQTSDTAFSAGVPTRILNTRYHSGATLGGFDLRAYDVSEDGQRFLMIKEVDAARSADEDLASMVLVMNWVEELQARLPGR